MGPLGNGDDSLTSNSGWGMMPPMNSGADWGSSSSIGANSSTSCWQNTNSLMNSSGRVSQIVSSNSVSSSSGATNNEQALSSSPKLSSSWAQAAGKGLMASNSGNNASSMGHISSGNSNNPSSNVIIQSSSNNSNTGPVSSDRHSSIANNNGPNTTSSSTSNNYSHDSYSAAINSGSNNQQQQSLNSNGTTASCSSNAFQTAAQSSGANINSSSNESSGNGGNKRAITTNIQDIIGNLSNDVRETLLTEKWRTVINQESPWNLPPSPQSSPKDTSQWRCPVNSGTEIWENTVRHKKGGPPGASAAPMANNSMTNNGNISSSGVPISLGPINGPAISTGTSSQPWGQPTNTHLGNWGEEEDTTNHWIPQVPSTITSVSSAETANTGLTSINWSSNGQNNVSNLNWNGGSNIDNSGKNFEAPAANSKTGSKKPWGTFENNDAAPEQTWDKLNENFGTWNADSNKKESGWDKESNDSYKGPIDDGTSFWGNPVRQAKVSNWKDSKFSNPASNNKNGFNGWNKGMGNLNGVVKNPIGPNDNGQKTDQIPSRSWSLDASQQRQSPSWNDGDNTINKVNGHGSASSGMMPQNNWIDAQVDTSHWSNANVLSNRHGSIGNSNMPAPNQKLPRDLIQTTNHFKNMGFKKDEVDNSLRNNQIRSDDTLKLRYQIDEDLSRRTGQCALQTNDRSRMTMMNAQNSSNVPGAAATVAPAGGNMISNTLANNKNLQMINFAISQGLLEQQILNHIQSSSPHVMEIINEIVMQIKAIRLMNPQRIDLASSVKYQQFRQNLCNLQRQLAYQSTPNSPQYMMHANRNANTALPPQTPPNNIEFFKPNASATAGNGNISANANPTSDLSSAFDFVQPQANQGSRLNSWKSQNKQDDRSANNDFIRAPGPLSKQNSTNSNNNWGFASTSNDDSNWSTADKTELTGSSLIDEYEFDYNKWKPPGAKALDDDPRSPLFPLSNIPKDPFQWNSNKSHILNSNAESAFSSFPSTANSNPWSYNPVMSAQSTVQPNMFDMGQQAPSNKSAAPKKNTWGNTLNANAPDYINNDSLWSNSVQQDNSITASGTNSINKSRPPPGLSVKMSSQNNVTPNSSVWSSSMSSNSSNSCEYLRLRNLNPQIDGPTLKTLCIQHGPLSQFIPDLEHGIAIVRYATREHAIKAQAALNKCVLGNTTIIADLPSNNEIQQFINTLAQQQQSHSLALSWSNGTDASHSLTVTAGSATASVNSQGQVGGASSQAIQSYQSQQTPQAAVIRGQQSSSYVASNSLMVNSANAASSQNLPYGSNGSVLSSHSSALPFGSSGANAASNSNKLDPASATWNNPVGSMMWDMNNSNSATSNLWSSSGFHTTDRSTPIQNFLPNDLLAGENN